MNVLFRCEGSSQLGLGHVARCLALASELVDSQKATVRFAMRGDRLGVDTVRARFPVVNPSTGGCPLTYAAWLEACVAESRADVLVLDVRDGLGSAAVHTLRGDGLIVATIDDPEEKRTACDLVFFPFAPQPDDVAWDTFGGKLFASFEYVILRKEFGRRPQRCTRRTPTVLVTMGGSDPEGLVFPALVALDSMDAEFETKVVLGPGFEEHDRMDHFLAQTQRPYDVVCNVTDMSGLMAQADVAVASFGGTAYELAAMGVPAIHVSLTEDHARSARRLEERGCIRSLGVHTDVTPARIRESIEELLADKPLLMRMSANCRRTVDALGAQRIAALIAQEARHGRECYP